MAWEIEHVQDVECELDDSGVYVIIHRIAKESVHKGIAGTIVEVRADLMRSSDNEPIRSWQGSANAIRKAITRFNKDLMPAMSLEHASYIGYELLRAELTPDYVQD